MLNPQILRIWILKSYGSGHSMISSWILEFEESESTNNKILDFNSPDIAKLANSFVTGIMNVYLENRVEIDAALGREVH